MIPVWFIVIMVIAFSWLFVEMGIFIKAWNAYYYPKATEPRRKWQFLKHGDDCIMMKDRCYIDHCNLCRQGDRFFAWRIPARTVKVCASTLNFKEGCNLYRAKLLRDIINAQKRQATGYPVSHYDTQTCFPLPSGYAARAYVAMEHFEPTLEVTRDGKSIISVNGNYKRGSIKIAMKGGLNAHS